jgi:hypothetical protein
VKERRVCKKIVDAFGCAVSEQLEKSLITYPYPVIPAGCGWPVRKFFTTVVTAMSRPHFTPPNSFSRSVENRK